VNGLARGLEILQTLTLADEPLGVTELAGRVGADKSTVHRLLTTLVRSGFVEQDTMTRLYRPTSKLVWMGSRLLARIDVRNHAVPYLNELARRTGFASHLVVLAQGHALYIGQERSPSTITVDIPLGGVAPAYCTAVGKVLLADLPPSGRLPYLADLRRHTDKTIVDLDALDLELALVRERGYAVDDEEFHLGVRCVAAPIRDHGGRATAAIGVSGPASDLPIEAVPAVVRTVLAVAEKISSRLGHHVLPTDGRTTTGSRLAAEEHLFWG
jgi:IclR family KDG regulon transcriptional repressor